jgi:hypothetical protein
VRYYFNGWRIGHLEEIKGKLARIRPLAAYDHNPRCRNKGLGEFTRTFRDAAITSQSRLFRGLGSQ